MLIKKPELIRPSEITAAEVYAGRRRFLRDSLGMAVAAAMPASALAASGLGDIKRSQFSTTETPNSYRDITTYNNFYEFGTGKDEPAVQAKNFEPLPWKVTVSGEAEVTGTFDYEDIIKPHPLEERIYRLRCVEAWSMVIPWVGFPLGDLLARFKPSSRARFVGFRTLNDPARMPGQRRGVLRWPYREGLRMDEAMHPLTILAVGLYGEALPNQNGAPLRLVVPWKYGFKSIKSITEIHFLERQPDTSWNLAAPHEYGFYANVNPAVAHPRWSQARERRIGAGLFDAKQPTELFNGYAEQVGQLYSGMDLRRNF